MKSPKTLVFLTLFTAMALSSCSGTKTACTSNCTGSGNGSVSVTMVADTLPANPSILSLQVTIIGITFTSSAGTNQSVTLNPAITLDLMRLQSDTAFLGTFANIPSGQYTSATLAFSNPAKITFLNDTTATLSGCAVNAICPLTSNTAAGTPVATVSFAVPQSGVTGIGIDLNLSNAVSISGATLAVNLSNNNVISAFTLPRQGSNLSATQRDLIEDFSGVVSLSSNTVTITSPTRGTLTATATANTNFDQSPDASNPLCPTGTSTLAACVSANQVASMDAVLNSDGTFSIQEIEPLLPSSQDLVEGTITSVAQASQTQFVIVVKDKLSTATSGSMIGAVSVGDSLTANLTTSPNPFLVDTKGLPVNSIAPGTLGFFAGSTTTGVLRPGQVVAIHVISFTAASGNTLASVSADTVMLRWSRFTANPNSTSSQTLSVNGLPAYFGFTSATLFGVQLFTGTQGAKGVTNFDGIPDGSSITTSKPAAFRGLFIENSGNSLNFPFFAAKVRQH